MVVAAIAQWQISGDSSQGFFPVCAGIFPYVPLEQCHNHHSCDNMLCILYLVCSELMTPTLPLYHAIPGLKQHDNSGSIGGSLAH